MGGERCRAARLHLEQAAIQAETADRQFHDGFGRVRPALAAHLRRGYVGAAIGIHNQVDARRGHVQVGDIDVAFENGDDLQADGDGIGVQQRRLAGRLGAAQGEVPDLGPQLAPIEPEGPDGHAPSGGRFHRVHQARANLLVEPAAAQHQNGPRPRPAGEAPPMPRRPRRCASGSLENLRVEDNLGAPPGLVQPGVHLLVLPLPGEGLVDLVAKSLRETG